MKKLHIEGSIYGHLIGNAIGAKCQNLERKRSIVSQQLARKYADAGAMSLCTMISLLESNRLDLDDQANRLHEWYVGGYMESHVIQSRVSISRSIRLYNNGMPPDRCGVTTGIADNLALIRMLPMALWNAHEPTEKIVTDAHDITKFTNQQIEAQIYSALYCLIIKSLLHQQTTKATNTLSNFYANNNMNEYTTALNKIKDFLASKPDPMGTEEVGDSFWTSIQLNGIHGSEFEKTIVESIMIENCQDIAALTGSLTGLSLGINEIPQRWINQLELSSEASMILDNFVKKVNVPN